MLAYSAAILLLLALPLAYAEIPEIIVEAETGKNIIESGDPVAITGAVLDHGYRPIAGADVQARSGAITISTTTNHNGTFAVEFAGVKRIPATYTINIIVSVNNMTGFASMQFQVRGDVSATSIQEEYLSSEVAARYLGANVSDFEKDPIGKRLFLHYEKLYKELVTKQKEVKKTPEQIHAEQELRIAEKMRRNAINEFKPSNGTYGGYAYDSYISRLNPQIKDLVADQLNFTKNTFENAQKIRQDVIASGGTFEEARKAYLDAISIPRDSLEKFNRDATGGNLPKNSTG
ncbi:MAG: carboxypeptidase regulatory-like domain-containing protein [Nitrosopumilus sp. B06]|nr:MAG: carboxypeptidase regulatory-like domain-containing protein [Nitrosopumilus sp. B06]